MSLLKKAAPYLTGSRRTLKGLPVWVAGPGSFCLAGASVSAPSSKDSLTSDFFFFKQKKEKEKTN